jgi:hypothetical protein
MKIAVPLWADFKCDCANHRLNGGARLSRAHAAQGGVTLGPEQGELGVNFCILAAKSSCEGFKRVRFNLNLSIGL